MKTNKERAVGKTKQLKAVLRREMRTLRKQAPLLSQEQLRLRVDGLRFAAAGGGVR